jgi:hypothetical protein
MEYYQNIDSRIEAQLDGFTVTNFTILPSASFSEISKSVPNLVRMELIRIGPDSVWSMVDLPLAIEPQMKFIFAATDI